VVEGGADRPSGAEAWSALASWYDSLLVAGSGPHETAVACLLRLLPDLTGARVLDVACGQGLATRALVEAGATSVTGVDSAEAMIDLARQRTDPAAPVSYVVDGVTCQLGLMDIADLDATVVAARLVLRPGGWFVAIIGHPCFLAPHAATTQLGGQPARWATSPGRAQLLSRGPLAVLQPPGHTRPSRQLPPHPRHLPQHSHPGRVHHRGDLRARSHPAAGRPAAGLHQRADLPRSSSRSEHVGDVALADRLAEPRSEQLGRLPMCWSATGQGPPPGPRRPVPSPRSSGYRSAR